jgi:hypothetical protein
LQKFFISPPDIKLVRVQVLHVSIVGEAVGSSEGDSVGKAEGGMLGREDRDATDLVPDGEGENDVFNTGELLGVKGINTLCEYVQSYFVFRTFLLPLYSSTLMAIDQ